MSNLLDKLESLSKAATPGNWLLATFLIQSEKVYTLTTKERFFSDDQMNNNLCLFNPDKGKENAELVAEMRNSIDQLIAIVKASDKLRRHLNQSYKAAEFSPTAVLLGELNKALDAMDRVK